MNADHSVLDAVLDAWTRSNVALINLLRALPVAALEARATPTSPTVAQMCAHLHHERMISIEENAPEHAGTRPVAEWAEGQDVDALVAQLSESGARVRAAVAGRIAAGRGLDQAFAHPVQLVTFLIFHDGYHHGQIKLALRAAGYTLADDLVGELVWDVWRARGHPSVASDATSTPAVQ